MIALISILVAAAAVCVAVWQVRLAAKVAERANCLPILQATFTKWTSAEFHEHRARLLAGPGVDPPENGFAGLPDAYRESAYAWCDFCEHIGSLVLFRIVPERQLLSVVGTQLPQVWYILWPSIEKERAFRASRAHPNVSSDFLPHYEHLVARMAELGGREATRRIRRDAGVLELPRSFGVSGGGHGGVGGGCSRDLRDPGASSSV